MDISTYCYQLALTDANGNPHHFAYDLNGNKLTETRPGGQQTTYAYDALSQLITKTDPDGRLTTYAYDQVGQLTQSLQTDQDPDTADKTVSYAYDTTGNLTSVDDGLNTTSFVYDVLDHTVGENQTLTGPDGQITLGHQYAFTADSRKQTYMAPNGETHGFAYNAQGQLAQLTLPNKE